MKKILALTIIAATAIVALGVSPAGMIEWLRNAWLLTLALAVEVYVSNPWREAARQAKAEAALANLFGQVHNRIQESEDTQRKQAASLREMAEEIETLKILVEPLPPTPPPIGR